MPLFEFLISSSDIPQTFGRLPLLVRAKRLYFEPSDLQLEIRTVCEELQYNGCPKRFIEKVEKNLTYPRSAHLCRNPSPDSQGHPRASPLPPALLRPKFPYGSRNVGKAKCYFGSCNPVFKILQPFSQTTFRRTLDYVCEKRASELRMPLRASTQRSERIHVTAFKPRKASQYCKAV